ncbi:hypothetical protein SDC9_13969 [bioreactor metagenome]|uniref:Stage II sporulation protein P n=1 Tax=bioreactor metagenome TaxID=1076179 RepID=A0A644TMQ5_9ZZZZ|nr:stage II sporulation protein P [Negativicutes bacterium]
MVLKRRTLLITGLITLCTVLAILGFLHMLPLNIFSIQQKPEQAPQKVYDYYLIIDEQNNQTIMYVPLVVSIGDEVLSDDNKYYQIVRIEENRAYARFIKNINLDKYQQSNSP